MLNFVICSKKMSPKQLAHVNAAMKRLRTVGQALYSLLMTLLRPLTSDRSHLCTRGCLDGKRDKWEYHAISFCVTTLGFRPGRDKVAKLRTTGNGKEKNTSFQWKERNDIRKDRGKREKAEVCLHGTSIAIAAPLDGFALKSSEMKRCKWRACLRSPSLDIYFLNLGLCKHTR